MKQSVAVSGLVVLLVLGPPGPEAAARPNVARSCDEPCRRELTGLRLF